MSNNSFVLPSVLESQLVFEESLVKIKRDHLQMGQAPPYPYYSLLTHPFAVIILALTPEGAYVLTDEYRHPTGHVLIGCPGGYLDPEEDALIAAQRELLEETGYHASSFTLIGSAYPYAGFTGQKTFYVKAQEATLAAPPHLEVSEVIRSRLWRPEALKQAIQEGAEIDGTLCTALFFLSLSS